MVKVIYRAGFLILSLLTFVLSFPSLSSDEFSVAAITAVSDSELALCTVLFGMESAATSSKKGQKVN